MTAKSGTGFRLRKDWQIRLVLEKGRLFRGKYIVLRALSAGQIGFTQKETRSALAIVISRKKEKRAVLRNRMKRRLREIFRQNEKEIPAGVAYVAVAKEAGKTNGYREIEEDFLNLIRKSRE